MTCIAVSTAIPMLVIVIITVPLRMEIQGSAGSEVVVLICSPAWFFFLFATVCSSENLMFTLAKKIKITKEGWMNHPSWLS